MRTFIKLHSFICFIVCFNFSFSQSEIQTVRIDFENPEGFTRQIALGFTPDNIATDGVDYGYDALNIGDLEDDLNWMIEGNRYIIQGVGAFKLDSYYPLGMFLSNSGDISISLNRLENFENEINVYLYDLEYDRYTLLNETDLTQNIAVGNYINRFFLTFSDHIHTEIINDYKIETNESEIEVIAVTYSKVSDELFVKGLSSDEDTILNLYGLDGRKIGAYNNYSETQVISTSEIPRGIYLLTIENSSFSYSTKVCITN